MPTQFSVGGGAAGPLNARATKYGMEHLIETFSRAGVSLWVMSTFNQPVTVQAVGSISNEGQNLSQLVNIGPSRAVPAGIAGAVALMLDIDRRVPWAGIVIFTGDTAPTTGNLDVVAVVPDKDER